MWEQPAVIPPLGLCCAGDDPEADRAETSRDFATAEGGMKQGFILSARIPADQVFASEGQGYGVGIDKENEWVVIGGQRMEVFVTRLPDYAGSY